MKPSTLKVLRLLRQAGSRGVSTGTFAEERCPRFAARLLELRSAGYIIRSERMRDNAHRYYLVDEPGPGVVDVDPPPPEDCVVDSEASSDPAPPPSAVERLPETDDGTPALFDLPVPSHHEDRAEWLGAA